MKRDYYEILGVDRDSDDDAIKRAFRRRARELHPDVNPDPSAEAQFKEAAEAYEALSNAESRAVYDRFGHEGMRGRGPAGGGAGGFGDATSFQDLFNAFFGGDAFGSGGGRDEGEDIGVAVEITFAESASGVTRAIDYRAVAPCDTCEATGGAPGSHTERCSTCGGQGQVRQVSRGPFGQFMRAQICPRCHGRGEGPSEACVDCGGHGRRMAPRSVSLDIPAGIAHGQRIRVGGRGAAGERGGPAGDLYVQVGVSEDARFSREGLDIVTRVAVPVTDAMVGASVTVPTVDGEAEVELRAGTQPGDEYVLRGRGFPALQGRGKGDQLVVVEVRIPKVTGDEGRRNVERLAEVLDARSYREGEGFFDRLKHAFR